MDLPLNTTRFHTNTDPSHYHIFHFGSLFPNLDVFFIYYVLILILIITLFAIHGSFLTARLPLEELLEEKTVIFVYGIISFLTLFISFLLLLV